MPPAEYLVQYGHAAFVGRFTAAETVAVPCDRGDRVIVRSPRGVEPGVVLCTADDRFAGTLDPAAGGDLLRHATPADEPSDIADALLDAAADFIESAGLPLTVLDAEVLLDDGPVLLHAVAWEPCDADGLFAELSARFARPVRLFDLSRTPAAVDPPDAASAGCGKPGCGTESGGGCGTGGGCSSGGGCSRAKVKSADDLTAYFADLREKMHAHRVPLN
ncbi:MAG: hypothetical protein ACRC7O_09975 [Fimbriiglobus sp.]